MKTMIRSFASALVAVMTLGLVQTAQAYSITTAVNPTNACAVTVAATFKEATTEWSKTYVVIDLTSGAVTEMDAAPVDLLSNDAYKTTKLVMRRIEPGQFTMGDADSGAQLKHTVTLTKPYYMGVFEVTAGQYETVTDENPSESTGSDDPKAPVDYVSWKEVMGEGGFVSNVVAMTGCAGFTLPTEAQWEYACRAGTQTTYYYGNGVDDGFMWYYDNADDKTHVVGTAPNEVAEGGNPWGLYDMHGNVWEWCLDWYDKAYYKEGQVDPTGPTGPGKDRVLRSGSWWNDGVLCTSAYRNGDGVEGDESRGFRLAKFTTATTKYNITISKSIEHGTVTSNVASTNEGATVTLTVTPNAGYELASILVEGKSATIEPTKGEGSTYTFKMPGCDVTVSATFKEQRAPYAGVIAIPGTLQAENYDKGGEGVAYHDTDEYNEGGVYRNDGVDIETANGGYAVAYTADEEWLEYTVNVAEAGDYTISAYLAHQDEYPSIALSVDGTNVVTLTGTAPTHSWTAYTEVVGKATLTAGDHTVRIANIVGNIDWVKFEKAAATKHTITTVADPADTCEFTLSKTSTWPNDTVDFRFNLADGANLVSLTVYNTDNPSQTIGEEYIGTYVDANGDEWHYFTMPDYNVTIKVTTESGETPATAYDISTVADPEGTCLFTVYPETYEAPEGDWVDFRFNLADGANFVSLTVYNTDDPTQTIGEEYIYTYEDENGVVWYYFEMPDYNVTIKVTTESGGTPSETAHDISTVADPEGTCLFTLSKTWAWPNDTIDFRFDLADGANFKSLTVYNTDNPTETISEEDIGTYVDENGNLWYDFTMPDYNVTIKVTTEEGSAPGSGHKINTSVTPSNACEVHVQDSAQSGEEVYFELGNFAAGATLESLTASNMSSGDKVKVEPYEKGYIFTMPDADVLIEVVCSAEPPKDPEILNVTAQQRYPWNGLVDISYTVTGTVPDGYELKVSAMDGEGMQYVAKTITAEALPLTEGTHTLKWDMNADGYTTEVSDSAFFMVEAVSEGFEFGASSVETKLDLRTGMTREIALGDTETLTFSTDYEGGPTPPPVQEGVQLWENGPYFAETNIGAKNPQDYGYYFWWGDTVGYVHDDVMNTWTSVDGKGTTISFDAGDETAGQTYGKTLDDLVSGKWIDKDTGNLLPEHDAATAHLGPSWRMMTSAEIETLCSDVCDWKAVTDDDGNFIGYKVSGATDGYTDKSIFLPAAGIGSGSNLTAPGFAGVYWSSTPHSYNSSSAMTLYFTSSLFRKSDDRRYYGYPIRPVQSATASAAANGASNEGETVTITVKNPAEETETLVTTNGSGTVTWTPSTPGEYELHHIVNSADGSTEITNLVAYYNVAGPTTTVEVMPLARSYTSEIGAYTNGVLLTATSESTYIVTSNATVDVVFEANTSMGRYFKVNGVYTSIVTNTITASTDPYVFRGPIPDTGKKVGDSAYAFVDGGTCTIVGSGTADTRLSTVVSPGAIASVVIQPGITEVGARFFKDFKWLNAVTGGHDLKTVGEKAFYKCLSLETIDLDCTAVPTGLDGAVVYQNALKPDGTIYQIPNIKVKNHVATLYGKENLDDDWECLGPAEGAIIYDQGIYHFFQTRLVPEE